MKKKLKEYLLKLILIIPIAYFSLLFIIFIFQRNLLYHPKENNYFGTSAIGEVESFLNDPMTWSANHGGASSLSD